MLDFSVYKPPAEFKLDHRTGGENARKWSVSSSASYGAGEGIGGPRAPGA
jgi:hypothetical protein